MKKFLAAALLSGVLSVTGEGLLERSNTNLSLSDLKIVSEVNAMDTLHESEINHRRGGRRGDYRRGGRRGHDHRHGDYRRGGRRGHDHRHGDHRRGHDHRRGDGRRGGSPLPPFPPFPPFPFAAANN